MGARLLVRAGVNETAHLAPPSLISSTRFPIQVFLYGGGIDLLEQFGNFLLRGFDYLFDDAQRVFVSAVDALHVGDRHAAQPVHLGGEAGRGYGVHRAAQNGGGDGDAVHGEVGACEFGVDGYGAGRDGDLVESIHAPKLFEVWNAHA